jgi:hypothetical protein
MAINKSNGPVVVGGVGGSGTRVIAELLSLFSFYLGDDLNKAGDNLTYTLLFKRRKWFYEKRNDKEAITTGLRLFSKVMCSQKALAPDELRFLIRAVREMMVDGHNHDGEGRGLWPFMRLNRILFRGAKKYYDYAGWGWKEPNTHLLIPFLAGYFENLKYLFVMRNGLDMAFSKNQQQVYNWGPAFDVELPGALDEMPAASLKYWVRANDQAIRNGMLLGRDKFLLVNFDEMCKYPEIEVPKITSFLGIRPDPDILDRACRLPVKPKSAGRYKEHNLDQFDPEDISYVRSLGFEI